METPGAVYRPAASMLDTIEIPFYYLGLTTVPKRFMAGLVATSTILYATKPSSLFYTDGTPKPWALTSSDEGATYVPWWAYGVGVGVILGTFI